MILNPLKGFAHIVCLMDTTVFYRKISDKLYLQCQYYLSTGERLNFNKPINFNQKIQWIKVYDREPLYSKLADKYEVRKYISERIGNKHLIPLLGMYEHFDEIDFNKLPEEFVLECNHDYGSVIICKDKETFDINKAREGLERCLKVNYGDANPYREWVYKNIKSKIIVEKYMSDLSGEGTTLDYKFFCFNGEPKCLYVSLLTRQYIFRHLRHKLWLDQENIA